MWRRRRARLCPAAARVPRPALRRLQLQARRSAGDASGSAARIERLEIGSPAAARRARFSRRNSSASDARPASQASTRSPSLVKVVTLIGCLLHGRLAALQAIESLLLGALPEQYLPLLIRERLAIGVRIRRLDISARTVAGRARIVSNQPLQVREVIARFCL